MESNRPAGEQVAQNRDGIKLAIKDYILVLALAEIIGILPLLILRGEGAQLEFWVGQSFVMQDCSIHCLRLVFLSSAFGCL